MENIKTKPTILWVLQDNQVTPFIADFLKLFKSGLGKIDIQLMIPEKDKEALKILEPLSPIYFKATRHDHGNTYENYLKKKQLIDSIEFTEGLKVWQTLLLDDLGVGTIAETMIHTQLPGNIKAILLQIPTPLGSTVEEELIFHAWVRWAQKNKIYIAGYELLSLYTRWTMLPSILDGVITSNERSFDHLTDDSANIEADTWLLPKNEAKIFSVGASNLWRNGLQAPYHYRMVYRIPKDKLIVYVPHNVAMSYEYRKLIETLEPQAKDIHLMFSIGEDQVRGTHTHEEIIATISGKTLESFCSHSFHNLNSPWEMVMADVLIACSECYSSLMAHANGIPCIVVDPAVQERDVPYLKFISRLEAIPPLVESALNLKRKTTDLTDIIYEIVNGRHQKKFLS